MLYHSELDVVPAVELVVDFVDDRDDPVRHDHAPRAPVMRGHQIPEYRDKFFRNANGHSRAAKE